MTNPDKNQWDSIFVSLVLGLEATPFFGRGRVRAKSVSRLLKVVETQIWAQNDRNSRFYISTYNNPKLSDLPFSRNLAKTEIPLDAT